MRLRSAALAAALLATACGCNEGGHGQQLHADAAGIEPSADAAAAVAEADAAVMPQVILMPEGAGEARVTVSLARSSEEQRRGLMYVQHLPADAGMIFIFRTESVQSFWMKNTLIPLDMVFIRADLTVAGVVENAEPLTLDPRGVDTPSRFVLEVNGGYGRAHGIKAGTKVRFEGFTP